MTIEVVFRTGENEHKVTLTNVGECYYDSDNNFILSLEDNNGKDMADFREWTYWRKINE